MPHKILILGKQPPPYMGTSVWFETLQKANWSAKWQVEFFNVNIHQSLNTLGKTRLSSITKNMELYSQLKVVMKRTSYDLVLIPISQETIGFIKDSFFVRTAAKRATKVLLMLHGSNFLDWQENSSSLIRSYTKNILKKTDGMIVLGEKLKALFANYFEPGQMHVVPNGADFIFPDKDERSTYSFGVLYLSNLQPSKGIEDVIDAIEILEKKGKRIQLTVVGQWRDEQTKAKCLRKVKEQQLPITFTGPIYGEEKLKYFSQADVFVFPPRKPEGHPLVLVEAMAAGLPVIATNQGAIIESVIDNENGFIVDAHHPDEIANKLDWLLNHPDEMKSMGKKSKKIYNNKFTEEQMIRGFENVFLKVINE